MKGSHDYKYENGENNYANMAGDNINDDKSNGSLAMGEGNMRTLRGTVEIIKTCQ